MFRAFAGWVAGASAKLRAFRGWIGAPATLDLYYDGFKVSLSGVRTACIPVASYGLGLWVGVVARCSPGMQTQGDVIVTAPLRFEVSLDKQLWTSSVNLGVVKDTDVGFYVRQRKKLAFGSAPFALLTLAWDGELVPIAEQPITPYVEFYCGTAGGPYYNATNAADGITVTMIGVPEPNADIRYVWGNDIVPTFIWSTGATKSHTFPFSPGQHTLIAKSQTRTPLTNVWVDTGWEGRFDFWMDSTKPVTTSNYDDGVGVSGDAAVVLTATDNYGVAATYYKVDGGATQEGTSFAIAAPQAGNQWHTYEYWSVDWAGNEEVHKTSSINLWAV